MIDNIKYRIELSRLFRQKEEVYKMYKKRLNQALKEGRQLSLQEKAELSGQARFDEEEIEELINILMTDRLMHQADRLFVPIPEYEDEKMWKQCGIVSARKVLTNQGISTLRAALRSECKATIESWLPLFTALTGMIGVITGLLAVILR